MSRLPAKPYDDLTDRQKQVHDNIASGPRGLVQGPLAVWLNRPELADCAQALGQYCRFDSSLPPHLSELAILTTGRIWGSEFEWSVHKPIALKAGISADIVEAIRTQKPPEFVNEDEAVVYAFAKKLHTERHISDTLYAHAVSVLGQDNVVDLVGLLGYYTLISMTINAFKVPLPEGQLPELT